MEQKKNSYQVRLSPEAHALAREVAFKTHTPMTELINKAILLTYSEADET